MEIAVNAGAIVYGSALVLGAFVRTRLTEALRIDVLFIPNAGEKTRPLNVVMGLLIAGYGLWSLLALISK